MKELGLDDIQPKDRIGDAAKDGDDTEDDSNDAESKIDDNKVVADKVKVKCMLIQ